MDKGYYLSYYDLERKHWWFKARLNILEKFIEEEIGKSESKPLKILNAGIATGATTEMLDKFGEVTSLEFDEDCCRFVREKLNIEVIQGSLTELPFSDGEFDLVCAFDVIEHIENDRAAVEEIMRVLKSTGRYVVTVPAYNFLWSEHDEINHHFRRYTISSLKRLFGLNKNSHSYITYFNFWLFPPIAAARVMQKLLPTKKSDEARSDFEKYKGQNFLDATLMRIFRSENLLINRRLKLPFGVSILLSGKPEK